MSDFAGEGRSSNGPPSASSRSVKALAEELQGLTLSSTLSEDSIIIPPNIRDTVFDTRLPHTILGADRLPSPAHSTLAFAGHPSERYTTSHLPPNHRLVSSSHPSLDFSRGGQLSDKFGHETAFAASASHLHPFPPPSPPDSYGVNRPDHRQSAASLPRGSNDARIWSRGLVPDTVASDASVVGLSPTAPFTGASVWSLEPSGSTRLGVPNTRHGTYELGPEPTFRSLPPSHPGVVPQPLPFSESTSVLRHPYAATSTVNNNINNNAAGGLSRIRGNSNVLVPPGWNPSAEVAWSAKPNAVVSSPSRNRYPPGGAAAHPIVSAVARPSPPGTNNVRRMGAVQAVHQPHARTAVAQRDVGGGGLGRSNSKRRPKQVAEEEIPSLERKPYHPKAPSGGTNWVMWVGNMPHDATQDEAEAFFKDMSRPPHSLSTGSLHVPLTPYFGESGVMSVFLILQSHCAFVNYESDEYLQNALSYYNGRPFRPGGVKLVCRVRRKAEEIKSGVGGQRGLGLHRKWVEEHAAALAAAKPLGDATLAGTRAEHYQDAMERFVGNADLQRPPRPRTFSVGSATSTSTTSTLLATYFPIRYFVLKAMTKSDLQLSVDVGLWATQTHNEFVLDQAYRTSQEVYLIFGANKAGEFHGFARMTGPILSTTEAKHPVSKRPLFKDRRPSTELSPFEEHLRRWEATKKDQSPEVAHSLPMTAPTDSIASSSDVSTTPTTASQSPDSLHSAETSATSATDGSEDKPERQWGTPFRVEWVTVRGLPFHSTRMLRNSWNKDREVKVSRDGTELEPTIGSKLLELWETERSPDSGYSPASHGRY